jgi:transcriptional regulator with XRE-family HTH domain
MPVASYAIISQRATKSPTSPIDLHTRISRDAAVPKKSPNPIDKHVGGRVRMQRMVLGMSQEKLGDAIGLTFQQVQKYEKGANRISASRLQQIADVLGVPVTFFFDGAPGLPRASSHEANEAPAPELLTDFLSTSDGIALAKAFTRIRRAKVRRGIVRLVEELTTEDGD